MNKEELKNILSQKFDFDKWKEILDKIFLKVDFFTSTAKIADSHVKDGGHIGNIRLDDGHSLAIFCFEVTDNVVIFRNRKTLREIAAKYVDQSLIHGALVFYYSPKQDDYRLSFIAKQTFFNEDGEPVKKETAPKRYTFLLGKNEPCTTAASRIMELIDKKESNSIGLKEITNAFSVERLNKEFFNGYKAQYTKFLKTIADTKQHRDYVKKLLGRLVFLQFLQKKGWMGVPADSDKWENGDKNYLNNLIDKHQNNDRLLSDVLEPLFFKTLNEKRKGDIADSKLGDNIKIPYLNGGLFDKDRIDELDIDFPYNYFKELMEFFSQYNFTIDENDPDDAEIGVDPEMLGHIFENLLEDNKDKGAFYTPKEIVQYMCQQSVIEYLKTHTDAELHTAIETLVVKKQVDITLQDKDTANNIYNLLRAVKVCDPAIGSGAFPMGILNVLFHSRQLLYGFRRDTKGFSPEEVKRDIIQNNIFGVDIEQGAVDIARLRFWLSLVVDSEEPNPLPNLDYKIVCGNSLLSRYRLDEPIKNVFVEYNKKNKENKMSFAKYQQMVKDYLETSDHTKKDEFRKTIEEIKKVFKTHITGKEQKEITDIEYKINCINAPKLLPDYKQTKEEKTKLKDLEKELKKLNAKKQDKLDNKLYENAFEWRFEFPQLLNDEGDFIGFDIVIGNPPYGVSIKGDYRKTVVSAFGNVPDYEIYYFFIERANNLLRKYGVLSYIIPNTWLFNTFAAKYRIQILNNWNLIEVLDCTKFLIFESATVLNTIITWSKNQTSKLLNPIGYRNTAHAVNFRELLNEDRQLLELSDLLELNQNWGLAFSRPHNIIRLVKKIKSNKRLLNEIFPDTSQGLIAYDKYKGQSADIISTRAYHSFEYKQGFKKWLWGEDVRRYELNWNNKEYINYCSGIANPRQPKFFNDKRLLVREITNPSIYATITSEELYNDPAILITLDCNNDYPLEIVLAVLNSKLATFYHFNHSPKATKGAFPKILVQDLKEFPLPSITSEEKKLITDLVERILDSKKSNPQADTIDLENQIDFLVYKLYNLTYDEVLIVDPESTISREEYEKEVIYVTKYRELC